MKGVLVVLLFVLASVASPVAGPQPARAPGPTVKYVRFTHAGAFSYGILDGATIRVLSASPFSGGKPTGRTVNAAEARLVAPCEPSKVIAVGLNYQSHLGERPAATYPGLFAKYPTTIVGPGADIVFPPGAGNVHYEGEMVVVIGKLAHKVSATEAPAYVFGVTAGNDVSERDWQKADLQWFRAKASDTFGPLGPAIVTGLNYNDLQVQTRVNGEVRQSARTSQLIFDVSTVVSYVSQFVTLLPGDVIYTGTPGTTRAMRPGDVVEVEVEGVGVLRNTVKGPATSSPKAPGRLVGR